MTVVYAAPRLFDVYPATILDPSGAVAYQKVRAIGTPDHLVIYAEQDNGTGRRTAYTAEKIAAVGVRPHPSSAGGWIVDTGDGGAWTVTRGSGCGCQSPLKHLPSPTPLDL